MELNTSSSYDYRDTADRVFDLSGIKDSPGCIMRKYLFLIVGLILIIGSVNAAIPLTNFTSNVTSGAVPLSIQFFDTTPSNLFLHSEAFSGTPLVLDGLLAEYKFNDTGSTLKDWSGNGKDGSLIGSPTLTTQGIKFNGINQYAIIPFLNFSNTANYTIQIVYNTTSILNENLFSEGSISSYIPLLILSVASNGKISFEERDDTGADIATSSTYLYNNGSYFLTSLVRKSSNLKTYSGETSDIDSNIGVVGFKSANNTRIAVLERPTLASYFSGTISYVLLYNRSLSPSEISSNLAYINSSLIGRGITLPNYTNQYFWYPYRGSVLTNVTLAPDGNMTGNKFIEDGSIGGIGANDHYIGTQQLTLDDNTNYTFSGYIKAAERKGIVLIYNGKNAAWNDAVFNLTDGTFIGSTGGDYHNETIVNVGNGWYRCSASFNSKSGSNPTTTIGFLSTLNSSGQYNGTFGSGFYAWGAQLEKGDIATNYIQTINSVAPSTTAWDWSWGDGTANGTTQNPVHTYSSSGVYTVSLGATNSDGSNTTVKTGYITANVNPLTPLQNSCPTAAVGSGIAILGVALIILAVVLVLAAFSGISSAVGSRTGSGGSNFNLLLAGVAIFIIGAILVTLSLVVLAPILAATGC